MFSYFLLFSVLWLYRYVRFIVNCISHWTFKAISVPDRPSFGPGDVTVIIPTIDGDNQKLRGTIISCLQAGPSEIILVTVDANRKRALKMVDSLHSKRIRVMSVHQPNKRRQMCCAIPEVQTSITVFADDDVFWPKAILPWILAPFENRKMGGVGTSQRLRRRSRINGWDILGASYLERRNFDISACTHIDGGLPCLSGRTVAYRSSILQDPEFTYSFTHETWWTYRLNADDDNFITRWMVSHGWQTYVQYDKRCEVETTFESDWKFIKQCLRWSRSNWRSNMQSMFVEGHIWIRHPWSSYAVFLTTLTAWSVPIDMLLFYWLYQATCWYSCRVQSAAICALVAWTVLAKFLKHLGHFIRYPSDIVYFPIVVLFGYAHFFIKLYAMSSLDVTAWGSREGADADDGYRLFRLSTPAEK